MDIILGANGHVGSQVAKNLLAHGENITVITHDPQKKHDWDMRGAEVAVVDIHETNSLSKIFRTGQKLFFLNPPADPGSNTVLEEKLTVYSILEALKDSGIQKVIAESTYGAQPGDGLGDLGVLHEMEQGLQDLGIPTSIVRAAYYMSNWDNFLETARTEGKIYSFYPADFELPMVAPADIGKFAAELLLEPVTSTGTYYIEGPRRYSANDVAAAFSKTLNRTVRVEVLESEAWLPWLKEMGYSHAAAKSIVAMAEITLHGKYENPTSPHRGSTTLQEYITLLVNPDQRMQEQSKVKFISSFSVISAVPAESRKLFVDALGLPLKAHPGTEYYLSEKIDGCKHFGIWPLEDAARACFGQSQWPRERLIPQSSIEFEVASVEQVQAMARELESQGLIFLHPAKTEPWGQTVARLQSVDGNIVGISYAPHLHPEKLS
ncbi:MAG TPA: NmrA family NAD(P)-binding protein [Bacteriovoracaceae bacterium]|nr:NmrA family NAD(P)-binding protein [Bacteriovoracaceae bacterium]